jgi:hypothetical protein
MRVASRSNKSKLFPKVRGRITRNNFDEFAEVKTRLPLDMYDKVDIRKLSWEDRCGPAIDDVRGQQTGSVLVPTKPKAKCHAPRGESEVAG